MEMKNKLYCHHKSKAGMLTKQFSVALFGLSVAFGVVAVPTYISSLENNKVATLASEGEKENDANENDENSVTETEENLLEY